MISAASLDVAAETMRDRVKGSSMTLINGYLAFKYHTDKELIIQELTYRVALVIYSEAVE